ncbi:dihydrouridine synthase family [Grosmannia clavigera kw1407]|uniref:tRNA-dihydrouridine(16/17) synthase [NAD(P)(+)] n=1 Tax=Grosmannia clavigera (strain kw1407 / UAMH 11150) TaxID=655863 RepID=F0XQ31_GROCL|nr:dihydrouridine synthase family [Grosmannia clavigera kw1407]EFX00049.1 dihydrouridine synthase family [Grosmannia clavigera kw1407]
MASSTAAPIANGRAAKLHGRAFYESIGSPKYIVAPMVDQSEFAWRMLVRSFLAPEKRSSVLAYSPMLHARLFVDSQRYRESHFEAMRSGVDGAEGIAAAAATPHLDGNPAVDRPLFVQFCANDPTALLAAARLVAPHCDAVDLNLGCPQGIARKGRYGAFLQEDRELIVRLIRALHEGLDVPVTAKIRILDTREATLQYAQAVLAAGASILTVHGRRRDQKGHLTGIADWATLRFLRDSLPPETVLFANGNVLQPRDLQRCLDATGFDGVMSAEGLLSDPGLFGSEPAGDADDAAETDTATFTATAWWPTPDVQREYWTSRDGQRGGWRVDAVMRRYLDLLHVYALDETVPPQRRPLFLPGDEPLPAEEETKANPSTSEATDETGDAAEPRRKKRKRDEMQPSSSSSAAAAVFSSPNFVAAQAHLFHLLRHAVGRHHDVRDALARSRKGDMATYERILAMLEHRVAAALTAEAADITGSSDEARQAEQDRVLAEANGEDDKCPRDDPDSSAAALRRCRRPWWVVQPVLRPMPAEALAKGAIQLKKKDRKGDIEKVT